MAERETRYFHTVAALLLRACCWIDGPSCILDTELPFKDTLTSGEMYSVLTVCATREY